MFGLKVAAYLRGTDLIPGSDFEGPKYKFIDPIKMYQNKGRLNLV